jgi:hypothetical protein
MPARRNPQDTASSTRLLQFFGALYGRMVGEKFFKYPGSMWVGGPPPFFPTPEAGESNMKIVFPEGGHGFALRQPI